MKGRCAKLLEHFRIWSGGLLEEDAAHSVAGEGQFADQGVSRRLFADVGGALGGDDGKQAFRQPCAFGQEGEGQAESGVSAAGRATEAAAGGEGGVNLAGDIALGSSKG